MSATLAARTCTRGIAGETVRMIQASHATITDAMERTYTSMRPTIYRPSRPSSKRVENGEDSQPGIVRVPANTRMQPSDIVLTVHRT